MKLSVLDQSPIRKGSTAKEALSETVQLAKLAERLGYKRFWVSEHHNTSVLAGTSPEVLISHLAGQTQHIRIGSGGVMLPHYSSLKVAENFRLLEALFPGRIDLGIGRAPGGDRLTASVLNPSNDFRPESFVQQLFELQNLLNDRFEPGSILEKVKARPAVDTVPEQWILSSSGESGIFAAHFGMHFAFAHFINPIGGAEAIQLYRQHFKPSFNLANPQELVAIFVYCSDDEEQVKRNKAVTEYRFLQLERGRFEPVSYEDILNIEYSLYELDRINANKERFIIDTPSNVKTKLAALAEKYDVDEVMIANIALSFEERMRSYELLADMFEPGR